MDDRKITMVDKDGNKVECEILFTYHSDDLDRDYIVFVDKSTNEIAAGVCVEDEYGDGDILPVESDAEWEMLEELLQEYAEEHPELKLFD